MERRCNSVEPSLPSQHQLEMCLQRLKASACHLARSGKGGEGCFILSLSRVRTWGSGYIHFGNGNQFPGNTFLFPIFASTMYSHSCSLCSFPLFFILSRDKYMPPKKTKPNDASDLSCDHAGMPSNHGVLNTTTVTHDDPC